MKPPLHSTLAQETQEAWDEYLDSCRQARFSALDRSGPDYDEVEPWAWSRLQQQLRDLGKRHRRPHAA